jgi:hypothetical protein
VLASCGSLGSPKIDVAPERCADEITAKTDDPPPVPEGAGFPLPVTPAERDAVSKYAPWITALAEDDREKTRRLRAGAAWCEGRK